MGTWMLDRFRKETESSEDRDKIREMRDFVYLDEISINDHLSSLGRAIPTEIEQSNANIDEINAGIKAEVPGTGIGGNVGGKQTNSQNRKTLMTVSTPYRFQNLLNSILDEGISIRSATDSLSYGDVVHLHGNARPMGPFKVRVIFESLVEATEILSEVDDSVPEAGLGEDNQIRSEDIEGIQQVLELLSVEKFTIRLESMDKTFAIPMYPESVRTNATRTFIEERRYSVFGRVEQNLSKDERWDPFDAGYVLYKNSPGISDEIKVATTEIARKLGISIQKSELEIVGPATVIRPIAIYW